METTTLVLMIAAGAVLFAGLVTGMVMVIILLAKKISGGKGSLGRLAERYAAQRPPVGPVYRRQTIQVGPVVYKRSVDLAVQPDGLYVARGQTVCFIPWSEFKAVGQTKLFWETVPLLTIGEPPLATMTVPPQIFEIMRKFTPAHPLTAEIVASRQESGDPVNA